MINNEGYYVSKYMYEDWHAGHQFKRINYTAYWFSLNGNLYKLGKVNNSLFQKKDFFDSGTIGNYLEKDKIIHLFFNEGSKFEVVRFFEKQNDGNLKDENQVELLFCKWIKMEQDEEE